MAEICYSITDMQKNYGLKEGISERNHGEKVKMVTIKEIAQRCGVSIATVSNILNGKPNASEATRQKVLKAVKELNYTPNSIAKNLKLKKSQTIGVLVEDITVFCALGIIDGITKCCEEKGYHILLTNLRLFKKYLKKPALIKASGGIRTAQDAQMYLELGCARLGTSSGVAIVDGWQA